MRVHLLALVILAVIVAFLVDSASDENTEEDAGLPAQQRFDYYMDDVESTHFNAAGAREYSIQATRFTHYPNPEYTTLDAPDITFYPQDDSPWFLTAERGRLEAAPGREEDQIVLRDNVVISHTDRQGQMIHIYTDYLVIFPKSRYLSTDRDVSVESVNYRLNSTGMTADIESRHLRFVENVRGRYE